MKKVLLTGPTSALSKEILRQLGERYQFVTIGRRNADIDWDMLQPEMLPQLPRDAAAVIHVAALVKGDASEMIETNVRASAVLYRRAAEAGVQHFIFLSSMSAAIPEGLPYHNAYAISKRSAELFLLEARHSADTGLTILRPSQLYGSSSAFSKNQPLLYTMVDRANRGESITIYGSNDALRNYLYVDDLTNVLELLLSHPLEGVFSAACPRNYRLSEIAETALRAFGKGGTVMFDRDKPDIPDNGFTVENSIFEALKTDPPLNIVEGMLKLRDSWVIKA